MKNSCIMLLLVIVLLPFFSFSRAQGTILTSPRNFTFVPGTTPSPIQLTCDVTPVAAWVVNNENILLNQLPNTSIGNASIELGRNGTNLVIINPMNNSEYFCSDGITNGEPYYIFVAGLPAMIPDVTVDDNIIRSGNIITLTLSWGEPFNNLDPIVNYTVSCSGDVTCPPNFTTTDTTTRSYTITNLTPMTNYTFSVVATNSIGSGKAGVVMITTPPSITGVTLTCGPIDVINQCTVMWNPITQGDITGYQVYYNETIRNVNSSTTTLTFTAPSLPDGVFTGTVVVMVTAFTRFGIGPNSDNVSALINASSVIIATPRYVHLGISQLYNITFICAIHPDSTADRCVVMAMADDGVNRTGSALITNGMAAVTVFNLHCNVSYNIIAGGRLNETPVGPRSSHGNVDPGPCPTIDDESDDELSTGVAVAISIVVTFIITLVSVLITLIITSLYYKHHYNKKSLIRQEGDSHALTEDIKSNDPAYATAKDNITMETNPAYGTDTIKMKTNPAYATATSL